MSQYWFRSWLNAKQSPNHYLYEWWPVSMTHTFISTVTRLQWVKSFDHPQTRPAIERSIMKYIAMPKFIQHIFLHFVPLCPDGIHPFFLVIVLLQWWSLLMASSRSHAGTRRQLSIQIGYSQHGGQNQENTSELYKFLWCFVEYLRVTCAFYMNTFRL